MTGLPRVGVITLSLLLAPLAVAEDQADAGVVKAETCRGCHGIAGYKNVYPTYRVPRLAGQNKDYLVIALKAYKSGERSHKNMQSQVASLSDQEIEQIAAYFSAQSGGEQ